MDQNFSRLFQRIRRVDRTVGFDLEHQTFVVGLTLHAVVLDFVLHVLDRRVNSIDRNYPDFSVCRHVL